MNEANDNLKSLEAFPPSSVPDLPTLPKQLNSLYQVIPKESKRLFIRVFRWLWVYLNGKRVNIVSSAWAVNLLRLRAGFTSSELAYLCFLYQVTNKGVNSVRSEVVYSAILVPGMVNISIVTIINTLKLRGYVVRAWSDPAYPYLSAARSSHPIFIRMTAKGVKFIEDLNREVNNIMMRQSLADLTMKQ